MSLQKYSIEGNGKPVDLWSIGYGYILFLSIIHEAIDYLESSLGNSFADTCSSEQRRRVGECFRQRYAWDQPRLAGVLI